MFRERKKRNNKRQLEEKLIIGSPCIYGDNGVLVCVPCRDAHALRAMLKYEISMVCKCCVLHRVGPRDGGGKGEWGGGRGGIAALCSRRDVTQLPTWGKRFPVLRLDTKKMVCVSAYVYGGASSSSLSFPCSFDRPQPPTRFLFTRLSHHP